MAHLWRQKTTFKTRVIICSVNLIELLRSMNRLSTIKALEEISQDIEAIVDERSKTTQKKLLNLIEMLSKDNDELRAENQRLRDENNRLKGEQGKPDICKQTNQDISYEDERNKNKKKRGDKKKKKKRKKKNRIKIDRVEKCKIDKDQLPEDAVFKGYQSVIVQDIVIKTDNIEFEKETYY